ncbi:MAG: 2OG-Fe(II) oxygenase [Gammaproteobacteria bacterium]|nr:2OG-Fe(II) oxygenase [Gammaproteobacteria bacterium]NVK88531.1 2OG-Fe(II) oxygenase [Gammaproteobacteria bacterium]
MINPTTLAKVKDYADQYQANGVISIDDFLEADFAAEQIKLIHYATEWEIATLLEGRPFVAGLEEFSKAPAHERQQFVNDLLMYARNNPFQYFYEYIRLKGVDTKPNEKFAKLIDFYNSDELKNFIGAIIGESDIADIDGKITRYMPGHFLKKHCDTGVNDKAERKCAYVLSLTKNWEADWGGLFHMLDDQGRVNNTIMPSFNTLNIFRVPQDHLVSQVANYAPTARFSITGWAWGSNYS